MSLDEEESEWTSSKIKGFSFGDDDETPWEELSKYQSTSSATSSAQGGLLSSSASHTSLDSFRASSSSASLSGLGPVAAASVVSDRVKKAVRIHQSIFGDQDGLFASRSSSSVGGEGGVSQVTGAEFLSNDPRELRAELTKLRRQIVKVEQSRFTPIHPKETVHNIYLGKRFSLELYKSLQDKVDLIDEALKFLCGDAILTATLFAYRTLSSSRFLEVIATRPVALRHLSRHLEARGQIGPLTDLLVSLGRHEEAALIHYRHACQIDGLEGRTRRIKSVLQNHFHGHPDTQLVIQHLHLLERAAPVSAADDRDPNVDTSVVGLNLQGGYETAAQALLYFCYHHYGKEENLLQSPLAFKKVHKLTDNQHVWIALTARAKRKRWKDCEDLVITKGWLGGRKAKSSVDPSGVVRILHQEGAPPDVLQTFLQLIDDLDDRERLARRYDVPNAVIDCLAAARDRAGLQAFKDRLKENSPEWFYANHTLVNSNTKWKN